MSPKQCSLAEEVKEDACHEEELTFVPELKVLLSKRQDPFLNEKQQQVAIRGKVTISF